MLEDSFSVSAKEAEAGFCGKDGGLNPGWERGSDKTSSFLLSPSSLHQGLLPHSSLLPNHQKANRAGAKTCHLPEQALSWA